MGAAAGATDRAGVLTFRNVRSWLWWNMRELLDPGNDTGIALPPDDELKRELCAPKWTPIGKMVVVQSREEIIEDLGVSPDRATAVILAAMDVPKLYVMRQVSARSGVGYDPIAAMRGRR